jgi:type II secretory ATPase GspE/PulE/Tfp pilus assembly ATPase PilB-like protein
VLSTIHANNSLEIIPRLKSLDISSADIIKATRVIISQRLVRVLCPACKKQIPAPAEMTPFINKALKLYPEYQKQFKPPYKIYTSEGCAQCNFTGYLGQTGIFEIVRPEQIEDLEKAKYPKLIDDAVIKVLLGITSWEEVKRVLGV